MVTILHDLSTKLLNEARKSQSSIGCGLLFGVNHIISDFVPVRNIAPNPTDEWWLDPHQMTRKVTNMRDKGYSLLGIYYTNNANISPSLATIQRWRHNVPCFVISSNGSEEIHAYSIDSMLHRASELPVQIERLESQKQAQVKSKQKPLEPVNAVAEREELRRPADALLGKDVGTGKQVYLTHEGRQLSTYIIGTIGTGKSTLLEKIAIQDMQNGDGICFLDPHEDAAERLLLHVPSSRKDDVIYWDPSDRQYPFGLNPFFCPDEEEIDTKADNFIAALGSLAEFAEVFEAAPRMKDVMLHMAIAFIANQGKALAETPLFLTNETYRKLFYPALDRRYPQIRYYWEEFDNKSDRSREEQIGSTLNKVRRFQANNTLRNIFGQPTNAIDFRDAMDQRKIIIVKLNSQRLGADNAAFIGAFIVWEIFQAALSRADTPEKYRPQFHLLADEFQTYMTTAFPSLIEQVRKFNVDVTVAHQRRDQLPISSRNAPLVAGNKVVFTVTGHDAHELAKEFRIVVPEPEVTGRQPKYQFVTNVLDHLATHGHEDPDVTENYEELMGKLDSLAETMRKLFRETEHDYYNSLIASIPKYYGDSPDRDSWMISGYQNELEIKRQRFIQDINRLIYRMMVDNHGGNYARRITDDANKTIPDALDNYFEGIRDFTKQGTPHRGYINLIKAMRENGKRRIDLQNELLRKGHQEVDEGRIAEEQLTEQLRQQHTYFKTVYPIEPHEWRLEHTERLGLERVPSDSVLHLCHSLYNVQFYLSAPVFYLGKALHNNPCLAPTGQYEPVLEKPRLYSDVEAEIANTLATLPRFTARCKLLQDGQANEYTITTYDRPKPEIGAESTAQEIKRNSCTLYGRDRAEVEEKIARRLRATPAPAPRPEPPAQPEQESLDLWDQED